MNRFPALATQWLVIAFVSFVSSLAAQPAHLAYDWEKVPVIHELPEDTKSFPAVVLQHHVMTEYYHKEGANGIEYFTTEHKIVRVNSSAGIESYNKVYIPMHGERKLLSLRVRAVDPEGKITIFQKENLKELQNVDGYGNYKIFAIEGLTLNGELEYIYTLKSTPQSFGREVFQTEVPVVHSDFTLIYPSRLAFEVKSYNGLPAPKVQRLEGEQRATTVDGNSLPALPREDYSAYRASLMRVDYKITSNGVSFDMWNWRDLSEKLLKNVYDSKGTAKVNKMLRSLKLEGKTDLQKVRAVEKYIKDNFTIQEAGNESYEDIKEILNTHVANERGLVKIYMSCWEELNIRNLLVFASARSKGAIDPEFPLPNALNETLFYFPSFKLYLTPADRGLRTGPVSEAVAGSEALFITYYVKYPGPIQFDRYDLVVLDPLGYEHNHRGVNAKLSFGESLSDPEVMQENFFQGYRAFQFRGIYASIPEERRDEFLKNITVSGIENFTIIKQTLEGKEVDLSEDPDSYFRIKTNYKAPSLIEQAGDDYLISVGKLIGRQSELYQEAKRQTNITIDAPSYYNHELTVQIPEGYTCSGLEAIRIDNEVKINDKPVVWFKSDYTVTGNTLTIKVNEVYSVLSLPKEKYDGFRKVINSAADFNKVVVVLQPKK